MAKEIGYGTVLEATSSGGAAINIAYLRSIEGPGADTDEVEATTFDTTSNFKEFVLAMIDPGELSMTIVYDPKGTTDNTHIRLTEWQTSRELIGWRIIMSTTTNLITFNGRVKSFQPSFATEALNTAAVTLRLTGAITWPTS